ncbi:immunoglobulin-like domain-containing protein [Anaerorhabdus furcosa]|uniref:Cysteine-rich secretory protein family protein n=1 Tax=Anaerorhabdus furcosa TaxID=118967 RepID=A0A1T4MIZ7_9FIRM|nr:immunoglobulin-like domain-containing protein [Anaerorhabdus furcosa]SJZ67080.1 Cysteine-rich secretory protein family protein [Anaerorhabdus furcosa]
MKAKKLVLTAACILVVLCGSLSENIQEVQAEETTTTQTQTETVRTVSVEVNSTDAFDQIKTAVIQNAVFEESGVDPSLVAIEKCEMTIGAIDTTKVGIQDINVMINVKPINESTLLIKQTITTKVSLHIVDTQAPTLGLTKDSVRVQLNQEEFNPWDYIEYVIDNSKENLYDTLQLESNVDTYTEGDYFVRYTATDSSGNKTEIELPVKVSKKIVVQGGGVGSGDEITYMLQLINNVRSENGLSALSLADEAGQTAIAIRASESVGDVSHRRPDGSHYKTALSDQGVSWDHSPLEILTCSGSTVEAKLNWWLNSPGHRSILLQPNYDTIAIGYSGNMWAAIVY